MDLEMDKSESNTRGTGVAGVDVTSIFQPDSLVHTEFFEQRRGRSGLAPEKRLMLAVLEDAVVTFQENHLAHCGERKKHFDDAAKWIFRATDWVFGFENICGALELDPGYIRSGLKRWRQKELDKRQVVERKKGRAA